MKSNNFKNNKGFTLVELLATIAIIAAIFTIAIISLNGVSKKKKEVAYESVKQEVVTAAQQYLASNKYMLETLKNSVGSDYCNNNNEACNLKISVQELVNSGYLNKTINPTNNTALNNCDYVNVSIDNNKEVSYVFKSKKDDTNLSNEENDCPNVNLEVKNLDMQSDNDTVPDVPVPTPTPTPTDPTPSNSDYKLSAIIEGKTGLNGWLVGDSFDVHVKETGTKTNNLNIQYCILNISEKNSATIDDCSWNSIKSDSYTSNNVTYPYGIGEIKKSAKYTIYLKYKEDDNNSAIKLNIKFDNVAPTISYTAQEGKLSNGKYVFNNPYSDGAWYNGYVLTSATCKDDLSGCGNTYYTTAGATTNQVFVSSSKRGIYAEGTSYIVYEVFDQAGNSNKTGCTKNVQDKKGYMYCYKFNAMVVKLERNVSIRFAIHDTNWTTSIKNGKYVFNTSGGAKEFNTIDVGSGHCINCVKERYATSCMNVDDYRRYFYVTAASLNNGKETEVSYNPYDLNLNGWKDGCEGAEKECGYNKDYEVERIKFYAWSDTGSSSTSQKYRIIWNNGTPSLDDAAAKTEHECTETGNDVVRISAHQYQYTSPAGNKSDIMTLYVDYYANCGY